MSAEDLEFRRAVVFHGSIFTQFQESRKWKKPTKYPNKLWRKPDMLLKLKFSYDTDSKSFLGRCAVRPKFRPHKMFCWVAFWANFLFSTTAIVFRWGIRSRGNFRKNGLMKLVPLMYVTFFDALLLSQQFPQNLDHIRTSISRFDIHSIPEFRKWQISTKRSK